PPPTARLRPAGAAVPEPDAWLPLDAVTTAPTARSASTPIAIACVYATAPSQCPANRLNVPRLMFTASTSGWCVATQSMAATMSDVQQKLLRASSTLTATTCVFGTAPRGAMLPAPTMMPLTLVPCPLSSTADPGPDWVRWRF